MLCFFHLRGAVDDADSEGLEVATIDAARVEAAHYLGEVIREQPNAAWGGDEIRVEVTDADQLVLFTIIAFGVDAAAVEGQPASFRPKLPG